MNRLTVNTLSWMALVFALCALTCAIVLSLHRVRPRTVDMEAIWAIQSLRRAAADCPERDALEELAR